MFALKATAKSFGGVRDNLSALKGERKVQKPIGSKCCGGDSC